jgi:SAM-dependent methyltransferase
MKLSDIVHYRNQLDIHDVQLIREQTEHELLAINHVVASQPNDIGFYKARMAKRLSVIRDSFEQFDQVFDGLKSELDSAIQKQQPTYYRASMDLYQQHIRTEPLEKTLSRRLTIDDDSNLTLRTRLRNYTDWRLPGLIIRPGRESFIEELVPLDPLYVVDTHQELIDPAVMAFNETYRARLRQYVLDEDQDLILADLPDNQFGLIFAYNYFNFKPMELIQRYITEAYQKLRAGGTLIMTYNNCDQAHGVALAEQNFMCYTPGSEILKIAESVGFDVTYQHTGLGDLAWMELQRPGKISSLRGGQTLAKIVARPK